jgi:hypothetical protein
MGLVLLSSVAISVGAYHLIQRRAQRWVQG